MFNELALASFPPSVLVAGRIVIATMLVYGYLKLTGERLPGLGRAWLPMIVLAALGNVLPFHLIAWAQQHVDSSVVGVLMAVMPLFVLTLAHFFVAGARLTPYRIAGSAVGFVGVVVVIGPNIFGGLNEPLSLAAAIATLGAALSYAVSTIYARQLGAGDPLRRATGMLIVASLLSIPTAALELPNLLAPTLSSTVAMAVLGLLATGLATLLYFRLVQGPGPTFISFVNYLVPAWAVIAGAVFLDEPIPSSIVFGLALILGGIAFSELGARAVGHIRKRLAPVLAHTP